MSAATGSGRVGRPEGSSLETLERRRRVQSLSRAGLSVAMIAECENCTDSYVRLLLKEPRVEANAGPSADVSESRPRPLSRRTVMDRAWTELHLFPLNLIDKARQMSWLRAVMIICDRGDGAELRFGARCLVRDLAHFARGADCTGDEVTQLFDEGLLVELDDGAGVAMPHGMHLRPKEGRRRAPPGFGGPSMQGQREMLQLLPGGRSDENEIPLSARIKPLADQSEITADHLNEIMPEQNLAAKGTTIISTKALENLTSSTPNHPLLSVPPAHENPNEIPQNPTEITSERSRQLARKVSALCGLGEPKPIDFEATQDWLALPGISEELILAVVGADRAMPEPRPVWGLGLFTKDIRGALSIAKANADKSVKLVAPSTLPPPPAPLSADELLKQEMHGRWDRWFNGNPARGIAGRTGPMPPRFEAFKPYCDGGAREAAARRWVSTLEKWWSAGRPADGCPPEFADAMHEIEALGADVAACEDRLRADDADE